MYFVEPDALNRTGLAVGKDHGLADKLRLGSLELAEDRACALLHGWHDGVPQIGRSFGGGLSLKNVEVVTSAQQRYVDGTAPHSLRGTTSITAKTVAGARIGSTEPCSG